VFFWDADFAVGSHRVDLRWRVQSILCVHFAVIMVQNTKRKADATDESPASVAVRSVKSMLMRSFVKENHTVNSEETIAMQLCRIDPKNKNLCATIGGSHLSVYDTSHCGQYLAIMSQYYHPHPDDEEEHDASSPVKVGSLCSLAWLLPEPKEGDTHSAQVATGTSAGQVVLLNVTANKAFDLIDVSSNAVTTLVAFAAAPHLLLAGNVADGSLSLFDIRTPRGKKVAEFSVSPRVTCVVGHPVEPAFFTGHDNGKVHRWELPSATTARAKRRSQVVTFTAADSAVLGNGNLFAGKGKHKVLAISFGGPKFSQIFVKDQNGRVAQWSSKRSGDLSRVGTCVVGKAEGSAMDVNAEAELLCLGTNDGEVIVYEICT